MKYDLNEINDACNEFNLLDYASKQYEFKRMAGNNYCSCPLHEDKTPSLCISDNSSRYYCFSCGASGNLLTWMTQIEQLSYADSIKKISKIIGMNTQELKTCETLKFYKEAKRLSLQNKDIEIEHEIISAERFYNFSAEIPQEWLDEGISADAMKKYEIRIDNDANRIVYPVRDNLDRLIGIKGRTRFSAFKELGIAKYMNYVKIGTADFFAGMQQAREEINRTKTCIIFEGIKSCMKAYDMGYYNTISCETSCLNDEQVKILIKSGVKEVIIAFDSDVCMEKIYKATNKLKRFTNVYVIKDNHNLLGEKEAPVDRGKEIFETLYNNRRKI